MKSPLSDDFIVLLLDGYQLVNINQHFILQQQRIIAMRTRSQLRKEDQAVAATEKPEKKKTKKELLEQKNRKLEEQVQKKDMGKKKVKAQQQSAAKTRRSKLQTVRVSAQKQPEVKVISPQKKGKSQPKKDDKRASSKEERDVLDTRARKSVKEDANPQKKEDAKKSDKSSAKSALKDDKQEQEKEVVKTIQFKGKVPIDEYCSLKSTDHHVLEHDGKVYSATLNQTKLASNNNKFYIIQVIQKDNNNNSCYFYTRWGRVGVQGQFNHIGPHPMQTAIMLYRKKYHQKHNNGDYEEIQLNYEEEEEDKKDLNDDKSNMNSAAHANKKEDDFDKSKLPTTVKKLIELIFDLKMMNKQMIQIGYNTKKMPLGKLSKKSIEKGYEILKKLLDEIKGKHNKTKIDELSGQFYTFIPHDFGFNKMIMFSLDNQELVKKKIQMLEALAEIKVATALIDSASGSQNQLDSNYKKLNREINPVDKETAEFEMINKYLQTTHASTHTSYELELADLFTLRSIPEDLRYTKDIPNKMLLWHGSRLTNFVGILSQGLRIAPPEAPVTGYMFGKGVYFADMSSKSANYCFTSRESSTGILLLCEVALGEMNEKIHADYYAGNLPPGKHSTKGMGRNGPNPANAEKLEDGVVVPMGPGEQTSTSCTLLYNQFIVYDVAQIRVRYLLRTKFNYK